MRLLNRLVHIAIILSLSTFVHAQKEESVSWNDKTPLEWVDFEADYNPKSDAVALTASGITFGYSIGQINNVISSFKAQVYAHFYPARSWVKPEHDNEYILAHEQLHFDITELHARLMRKELSELRISNNIKQRIQEVHRRISMDLDRMQILYDSDTNHSINREAQLRWIQEVKQALKVLEDYQDPQVTATRR
ncbi:MAG: DUF922 domain-containing protein [Bacteroidota bacterium]